MVDNLVIRCIDEQSGKEIIKFFKNQGINTYNYMGAATEELYGPDGPVYYGIVDGKAFHNHKMKHLPPYVRVLTLEEAEKLLKKSQDNILLFLKELKNADELIPKIFLDGSCFRLYKILKTISPTAQALYSHKEGHWITKIGNNYYDINGMLNPKYVEDNSYSLEKGMEQSAYVHTYSNNLATQYTKYIKTI